MSSRPGAGRYMYVTDPMPKRVAEQVGSAPRAAVQEPKARRTTTKAPTAERSGPS